MDPTRFHSANIFWRGFFRIVWALGRVMLRVIGLLTIVLCFVHLLFLLGWRWVFRRDMRATNVVAEYLLYRVDLAAWRWDRLMGLHP